MKLKLSCQNLTFVTSDSPRLMCLQKLGFEFRETSAGLRSDHPLVKEIDSIDELMGLIRELNLSLIIYPDSQAVFEI